MGWGQCLRECHQLHTAGAGAELDSRWRVSPGEGMACTYKILGAWGLDVRHEEEARVKGDVQVSSMAI